MLMYWLLFWFFAIGTLFGRVDERREKPFGMLLLAWLVLVLMIGLRWHVGADWKPYELSWETARLNSLGYFVSLYQRDPGFYGLMWLFRRADLPFWAFNVSMAAMFCTGLVFFARSRPSPWLAIMVAVPYLVIVVAMSGVRQATAIGLVMMALVAFEREQALRFLIYIGLAAAFHASAILVLPLAGLSFSRTRFQSALLIIAVAASATYLLGGAFFGYSDRYLSGSIIQSSGTLIRIAMNVIPAVIFLVFRRNFAIPNREYLLWRNMSLASIASLALFFFINSTTALDRLVLYFFPLQIFVFSWVPLLIRRQVDKFFMISLLLVYMALQMFVFLTFADNRHAYIPYENVLFN